MRITNTEYSPVEVLAELVVAHGIEATDTGKYFVDIRASHEWLVTAWADQIEVILTSFKRYGTAVAETQFIRDHGVDVLLKFENSGEVRRRVGFQIKSNLEAARDSKRARDDESMVATLKRQGYEAERHGVVDEWWIVSCFDLSKYRSLVRAINSEVLSGKQGSLVVRHVEPRAAMAFLAMEPNDVDAMTTLLICQDDEVLKMARLELASLDARAQNLVLQTLGPALEGNRQLTLRSLLEAARPEGGDPQSIVHAVNLLESDGYLKLNGGSDYIVEPSTFVGLCALYFEGRARHEYRPSTATQFLRRMTQGAGGA